MAKARRMWTDDQKRQLVAEFEASDQTVAEFCAKHDINSNSWFSIIRRKFGAGSQSTELAVVDGQPSLSSMDPATRATLLREYQAKPVRHRKAWRDQHGTTLAQVGYWLKRTDLTLKRGPGRPPGRTVSIDEMPTSHLIDSEPMLLATGIEILKLKQDIRAEIIQDLEQILRTGKAAGKA